MLFGLTSQCFTGDTLVSTEDGLRPIEEIRVGDYVWAEDTETGKVELKKVLAVSVTESDTLVHVTTKNGTKIDTTENHPFYAEDKGWTAAAELEAGDVLHTQDGEIETVSTVEVEKLEEAVKVYNLEVEDSHTYYVSADKVLVHNMCGTTDSNNSGYQVSDKRRNHILEGEGGNDPEHGPNRGFTQGAFPDTWTDNQVINAIEAVANSLNSTWKQVTGAGNQNAPITLGGPDINAPLTTSTGRPVRFSVRGRNHGLNIQVIIEVNGEGIITGDNLGK